MSLWVLRYPELRAHGVPWSQSHITRLEKAKKFPRRVRLSDGTHVWLGEEVVAFINSKIAQRDKAADANAGVTE
jgi:prophage regulatory protein